MPESFAAVTPQGAAIAELFLLALVPSALIFLLVVGVLGAVLVRFRGRPGDPDPPPVHGNTRLEVAWTAIPALLLAVFFVLMVRTMGVVNAEPAEPLRVQVIGHQWWWEYRYPDLNVVTANELHVPVGTPLRLELTADDVIHSFWVPRIGWKKDAIPGKVNTMSVRVDQAGSFEGTCTEFCGAQHAWMRILVVAQLADDFQTWVDAQRAPFQPPADPTAQRGRQLFEGATCVSCHTIAGTVAAGRVGPDLSHVGSRAYLGSGVLENTPDNLGRWIREAHAIKPGVLMPAFGDFSADDVAALAAYLESRR